MRGALALFTSSVHRKCGLAFVRFGYLSITPLSFDMIKAAPDIKSIASSPVMYRKPMCRRASRVPRVSPCLSA